VKSTNYEAPHYVTISVLVVPSSPPLSFEYSPQYSALKQLESVLFIVNLIYAEQHQPE
jgi:hypothetical protein